MYQHGWENSTDQIELDCGKYNKSSVHFSPFLYAFLFFYSSSFYLTFVISSVGIILSHLISGETAFSTFQLIISTLIQIHHHDNIYYSITQMRNSLGKEEGGSGIPLDREAYMKSVDYWTANVNVQ